MNRTDHIIQCLCTIRDEQSIGKAAKMLSISQPALSAYLKKLEQEIGTEIFDRKKSPLTITEVGKEYLVFLKESRKKEENFLRYVSDIQQLNAGKVVIGGSNIFHATYLSNVIAEYCKQYPNVHVEIIEDTIPEIENMLLAGKVDVFLSPTANKKSEIISERIFEEKVLFCVPKIDELNNEYSCLQIPRKHILSGELSKYWEDYRCINLKDFSARRFVLLNERQNIGAISQMLFKKAKFVPYNPIFAEQMATTYAYTVKGIGVSFISETAIRYGNYRKYPAFYVCDKKICTRKMYLCYAKTMYQTIASKAFIDLAKSIFYSKGEKVL